MVKPVNLLLRIAWNNGNGGSRFVLRYPWMGRKACLKLALIVATIYYAWIFTVYPYGVYYVLIVGE